MAFKDRASYSFIFDVYDPISYKVSHYDSSLVTTIFTYNSRSGVLFEKEYSLLIKGAFEPISIAEITKIPSCNESIGYVCQGLGGSEIWIRYYPSKKRYIVSKYWSPEDQTDTPLGQQLLEIKNDFDTLVKIDSLKSDFIKSLPKGRYSNFGGTEMRIKK